MRRSAIFHGFEGGPDEAGQVRNNQPVAPALPSSVYMKQTQPGLEIRSARPFQKAQVSRDSGTINNEQNRDLLMMESPSKKKNSKNQKNPRVCPAIQMISVSGVDMSLTSPWQNNYAKGTHHAKTESQVRALPCMVSKTMVSKVLWVSKSTGVVL